jgi:hypothetical protein
MVHAKSLHDVAGETTRSELHAEVCARRQTALSDQELRSFIVKQSVFRIHGVVAFALVFIALMLFAPVGIQIGRDVLRALLALAVSAIGSSVWSISRAVTRPTS